MMRTTRKRVRDPRSPLDLPQDPYEGIPDWSEEPEEEEPFEEEDPSEEPKEEEPFEEPVEEEPIEVSEGGSNSQPSDNSISKRRLIQISNLLPEVGLDLKRRIKIMEASNMIYGLRVCLAARSSKQWVVAVVLSSKL